MKLNKQNKQKLLLSLVVMISFSAFAQVAPQIQWQKTVGGTGTDYANSIQQTTDEGYIVAGATDSNDGDASGNHGGTDCLVVKLNSTGAILWKKTLGGTSDDFARSIQQTTDGGYILAGDTSSNNGNLIGNHGASDFWVVKLNSDGGIIWQKALGGSDDEKATSIQQTTDGGYIVAGNTYSNDGDVSGNHGSSDWWIVKLNAEGAIVWQKTLGGTNWDDAYSIRQTTDGGYIVAGDTYSNDGDVVGFHGSYGPDYRVVKLNSTGAIEWQKALGGTDDEKATSIQQTADGGYIMAGFSKSNDGDVSGNHDGKGDYWVVKLDSNGAIDWQKALGGTGFDDALNIQQTTDGGYIVDGLTNSNDGDVLGNHGGNDYWVVKLDSTGAIIWQKTLGGTGDDLGWNIKQTKEGGYIVAGWSTSNDGDVSGNHGGWDYWIVKLAQENLAVSEFATASNVIYPNPSNNSITIQCKEYATADNFKYKIIDLAGKVVKSGNSKFNEAISIESLTSGNYIIQIHTENGQIASEKLIKY